KCVSENLRGNLDVKARTRVHGTLGLVTDLLAQDGNCRFRSSKAGAQRIQRKRIGGLAPGVRRRTLRQGRSGSGETEREEEGGTKSHERGTRRGGAQRAGSRDAPSRP